MHRHRNPRNPRNQKLDHEGWPTLEATITLRGQVAWKLTANSQREEFSDKETRGMASTKVDWDDRDKEFDDDVGAEDSSDLAITAADFDDVLVAPSDWTIGTLYSQIGNQIDLDPDFQRRNVWNASSKSRFIESLFLGIPIPQILLSAKQGSKSSFIVLDGKQRLLTIKEFLDGTLSTGKKFKLRDLRILKNLDGKSWADIQKEPDISSELLNQTQRTTVLRGWKNENVLYEIFFRLNSGSVRLSPMELRTSLFPGKFLKFAVKWTENVGPLHHLLKKTTPDPRMADVELAVRFLAMADQQFLYAGDLKKFLDEACSAYNESWDDNLSLTLKAELENMNVAIDSGLKIFGEDKFCRKYASGKFENRFNRAIFDVQVGALACKELRDWALVNSQLVVEEFIKLSDSSVNFIRSIETTTKSKEATRTRFTDWYGALELVSNIQLTIPNIAE